MEIRRDTEQDIPVIVDLLKKSLGEDLMPKSEAYWRWKHVANPFGKSPALLAFDEGKLVGVRAFMRWQWLYNGERFESVRAVDTATHPDYQGRGIFKKLTLSLLDSCKEDGWHFVFNTPNQSSKPGYLKMGWKEAGKLPINMQVSRPVSMALQFAGLFKKQPTEQVNDNSVATYLKHPDAAALIRASQQQHTGRMVTAHTVESLRWRYHDVVVAKYYACGLHNGNALDAMIFYRIKPSKYGIELRITDFFARPGNHQKALAKLIRQQVAAHKADYVTVSGKDNGFTMPGLISLKNLSVGPIVTIRDITFDPTALLGNFEHWSPSVGDLELF